MPLQFKAGQFNPAASTTGNLSITGVGFQPKVVIFFGGKRAGTTDGAATSGMVSMGAAVSSSKRAAMWTGCTDAGTNAADSRADNTKAYLNYTAGTPTNAGEFDLVSLDSDGFTINRTTGFATNVRINYIAIGGTDLVNADVGTFQQPSGTGNQSVTGVGFKPDCVILFGSCVTAALPANTTGLCFGIGVALSSSQQFCVAIGGADGTSQAHRYNITSQCYASLFRDATSGTADRAEFVSMDADGFTINWTQKEASSQKHIAYVALRGGQYNVGTFDTETSVTTVVETGVGFQPVGLLPISTAATAENASGTTDDDAAEMSIGAASAAASEGGCWTARVNATGTADCRQENDSVVVVGNWGTGTAYSVADLASFDADGFTLNQTVASGDTLFFPYLAIGNMAPPAWLPRYPDRVLARPLSPETRIVGVIPQVLSGLPWAPQYPSALRPASRVSPESYFRAWDATAGSLGWLTPTSNLVRRLASFDSGFGAPFPFASGAEVPAWFPILADVLRRNDWTLLDYLSLVFPPLVPPSPPSGGGGGGGGGAGRRERFAEALQRAWLREQIEAIIARDPISNDVDREPEQEPSREHRKQAKRRVPKPAVPVLALGAPVCPVCSSAGPLVVPGVCRACREEFGKFNANAQGLASLVSLLRGEGASVGFGGRLGAAALSAGLVAFLRARRGRH